MLFIQYSNRDAFGCYKNFKRIQIMLFKSTFTCYLNVHLYVTIKNTDTSTGAIIRNVYWFLTCIIQSSSYLFEMHDSTISTSTLYYYPTSF